MDILSRKSDILIGLKPAAILSVVGIKMRFPDFSDGDRSIESTSRSTMSRHRAVRNLDLEGINWTVSLG